MDTTPPLETVTPDPGLSLADRVRAAGAESYGVEPEAITIDEPRPLAPSACVEVAVSVTEEIDGGNRWFVQLPDGTLVPGGTDEALALVSRRCFLDNGIVPDDDAAAAMALTVGRRKVLRRIRDREGPQLLGEIGEEWEPLAVSPTDDGFVITLFARDPEIGTFYKVTSTVDGDSATTEFEQIG